MANNKALQILRGTYANIRENSVERPLYGQPIFDKTNNYLLIGNQKTEGGNTVDTPLSELKPITTNRLYGTYNQYPYVISGKSTNTYNIQPDSNKGRLNIYTTNGVSILDSTSEDSGIKNTTNSAHLIAYGDNNYISVDGGGDTGAGVVVESNKSIELVKPENGEGEDISSSLKINNNGIIGATPKVISLSATTSAKIEAIGGDIEIISSSGSNTLTASTTTIKSNTINIQNSDGDTSTNDTSINLTSNVAKINATTSTIIGTSNVNIQCAESNATRYIKLYQNNDNNDDIIDIVAFNNNKGSINVTSTNINLQGDTFITNNKNLTVSGNISEVTGTSKFTGNVGIGTDSDSSHKLKVNGDTEIKRLQVITEPTELNDVLRLDEFSVLTQSQVNLLF